MSVRTSLNLNAVLVGKNIAGTAIASIAALGDMSDGQVIVTNTSGEALPVGDDVADSPWIRLCKRLVINGVDTFQFSPIIRGTDVIAYRGTAYSAGQEQIYVVGFNGTSGSIDTTATSYMFSIVFDHDDQMWSQQKKRETWNYTSTSPTQYSIAKSFTEQIANKMAKNILNGTGAEVKVEMLSDGTFSASSGGAFTVSNGSVTITTVESAGGANDAGKYAADASSMAVGDKIRIGGTGNTSPVYVITAVSGIGTAAATITLNMPYQGASGAVAAANVGIVTAATNYGFKITGLALTWQKDFFKYMRVTFHLDMVGFNATTLTRTQEALKGRGDYRDVAEWESYTAGSEGALNRSRVPLPLGRTEVPTDGSIAGYDCYNIQVKDTSVTNTVAGQSVQPFDIMVFFPDGCAQDTIFSSQLDPWMASLPQAFANVGGL